jgi:ATP-dependent helicase Lhr and Lhr-like helicase
MELGIDIGDLDQVYQLDAPTTVSSLAQRLGRSGRRPGTTPQMTFLLKSPEDLLVAMAVSSLFDQGWVESVHPSSRLWTVLVHQMFANLLETGGLTRAQLVDRLRFVPSFAGISEPEYQALLAHLIEYHWLDEYDGALMLGTEGERAFGGRNFFRLYAVFDSGEKFTVRYGQENIGSLDRWFVLQLSSRRPVFRLAGRAWKMVELDTRRSILRVTLADSGTAPQWTGRAGTLSRTICERILEIVWKSGVRSRHEASFSTMTRGGERGEPMLAFLVRWRARRS